MIKRAILINDTSNEQHIGCNAVIKNIISECKKNNIDIIQTFSRDNILALEKDKWYKKNIDLVIINGEGTFHHNPKLAEKLGPILPLFKPDSKIALINSAWLRMNKITGGNILKCSDMVAVREQISHSEVLEDYPQAIKVPDAIFLTQFQKAQIGYGDSVKHIYIG